MDTPNERNRSGEPLMRSLEELEQQAHPGEHRGEGIPEGEDHDALMPTTVLPLAGGHPVAAPVPEEFDDNQADEGNRDETGRRQ